ncbi:MAG: hypothetical protein IH987_16535, partial [Planctomycetes bacterium]|nr:hypothetical protein [Planctomycetota bacterium]
MWDLFPATDLWQTALAVLPLALIVAAICKWVPCRPATRHTLWLMLLVWMVAAPYLPPLALPGLEDLRSESLSPADPTWQYDIEPEDAPVPLDPGFRFAPPLVDSRPSPSPATEWTTRPVFVAPPSYDGSLKAKAPEDLSALDFLTEATRTESCLPMSLAQAADSVGKLPGAEESNISTDRSNFVILAEPSAETHIGSDWVPHEDFRDAATLCPAEQGFCEVPCESTGETASEWGQGGAAGALIALPVGRDGQFVDRWRLADTTATGPAP